MMADGPADKYDGDIRSLPCRWCAESLSPDEEFLPMSVRIPLAIPCLLALAGGPGRAAEPNRDIRELKLRDWEPRSMMVTKTTIIEKPRYPVIDIHNHLGGGKDRLTPRVVERYLT